MNSRSTSYQLARRATVCRACGRPTNVVAVVLPPGHETLELDEDAGPAAPTGDVWQAADAHALLFHVESLCDGVRRRLRELSPQFRPGGNAAGVADCWLNHCENCGAPQSDDDLHCEPGAVFMPLTPADAASIELIRCVGGLQAASAGYALEPDHFEFMRRA